MIGRLLLCSDLDRTLIPNGHQEESPQARRLLHVTAQRPEITLAYVSGRNLKLLKSAIAEFDLPKPDFAVGDVGTTIYQVAGDHWHALSQWEDEIAPDWKGRRPDQIAALFKSIREIELQAPENQNRFKVSYYAPAHIDYRRLIETMRDLLRVEGVRASLIWSVDEKAGQGLLDVLPENATKYHAIRFLMKQNDFSEKLTVFAGDSGNDLPVLTSGLQAVLVRNSAEEVRAEARRQADANGNGEKLYVAKGGFLGMNGNYAAGVLEGLAHFFPEAVAWFQNAGRK